MIIFKQTLSVAYDQTHDHQCLTSNDIVSHTKANKVRKKHQIKQERIKATLKATLSLEAYDL